MESSQITKAEEDLEKL